MYYRKYWGLVSVGSGNVLGYFIKYEFHLPKEVKHSSYNYQKLFRAIYGYTQNVSKGKGKVYRYYRKGVLSDVPYVKSGKNSIIIPPFAFSSFITFLKTGKNPTHYWRSKGDWKATYSLYEESLPEKEVVAALEALAERLYLTSDDGLGDVKLKDRLDMVITKKAESGKPGKILVSDALKSLGVLVNNDWFKACYKSSPSLSALYSKYLSLKQ